MESKALTVQAPGDSTALVKQSGELLAWAKELVIKTDEQFEAAGRALRDAAALKAEATKLMKDSKAGADKLHKDICAMERKLQAEPAEIDRVLRPKYLQWQTEKRAEATRIAEAARVKALAEEDDRRLAQAQQLADAGQPEVAEAVLDAPTPLPALRSIAAPKTEGIAAKVVLDFRIIDPDKVNRIFCDPSEKRIREQVRALGMKAAALVGGIEVFPVESLAVKAWK